MFVGAGPTAPPWRSTYTSADLASGSTTGAAPGSTRDEPVWMGALWECPQVFEVDGHWVMVSARCGTTTCSTTPATASATVRHGRFEAETWGQLSFGPSYYAPSFFRDREGRPCLMFWMRGVADAERAGGAALSLPHLLSVRDGRLVAEPHPDLARPRGRAADDAVPVFDLEWTPATAVAAAGPAGARLRERGRHGRRRPRPPRAPWPQWLAMPWSGGPLRSSSTAPSSRSPPSTACWEGRWTPSTAACLG